MAVSAGAYFIEAGVNNEEIDWKDFALTIIGAGVESAVSFGLGALLGATGLWQFNKQSAMRGLKKGWYRLNFSQKTDRILNFVGSGIWNLIKGPGLRTVTYFYGHYVKMQSVTERKKESRGVDFLVCRGSLRVFMITFVRF